MNYESILLLMSGWSPEEIELRHRLLASLSLFVYPLLLLLALAMKNAAFPPQPLPLHLAITDFIGMQSGRLLAWLPWSLRAWKDSINCYFQLLRQPSWEPVLSTIALPIICTQATPNEFAVFSFGVSGGGDSLTPYASPVGSVFIAAYSTEYSLLR